MPVLDPSELNIVIAVLGAFIILYGLISVKIKNVWYLGEALPAVLIGICLGPIAAKFLDSERWGSAEAGQTSAITLGLTRVMIGVQLVIAGYQLPAKYQKTKWKEMLILLVPVMTIMWLATTICILATIPKLSLLAALVIGSCVTCTDPILSQAVAKGPFSDKYVRRPLREIISSEAGANDGFGFPFLLLAVYLMRYAEGVVLQPEGGEGVLGAVARALVPREENDLVARQGGGTGPAIREWVLDTWLYVVLLSIVYGVFLGTAMKFALGFVVRRKWVDTESYVLAPSAIGLFIIGTAGVVGTDDLLACFVAGCALNWDGEYLKESERRHDEVNASIDVLLNFGGFMYLGTILPWNDFASDVTGITLGRLFGLGFLVLLFRRIPAIMMTYKLMPNTVKDWKEALFMGYFGPIGVGAIFYVEHTSHLFPELAQAVAEGDTEVANLLRAMRPIVYWLALFSIVVHGLSIPLLNGIYEYVGVAPITEDAVEVKRRSMLAPMPANAINGDRNTIIAFNRFSRPNFSTESLAHLRDDGDSFVDEKARYPDVESGLEEAKRNAQRSTSPGRSFGVPQFNSARSLSRPREGPTQIQFGPDRVQA